MSRLSLIWDGAWLKWATLERAGDVGRREIRRADMVVEVLRALRHQVGSGAQVVHCEWNSPTTVMPSALVANASQAVGAADGMDVSLMERLHALHQGAPSSEDGVRHACVLDDLVDAPTAMFAGSRAWQSAVEEVFPQARRVPWVQALLHDALLAQRTSAHDGWTVRADIRAEGARFVGMLGESLQWVHHLEPGCTPEDGLYAMVNAVHRGGGKVEAARVWVTGDVAWTKGWERFVPEVRALGAALDGSPASWEHVLTTLLACA